MVEKILYMLWDVGFKVGHSTRSVSEAIEQANVDMLSKTSLLEARLVAGDEELFGRFQKRFLKECVAGHEDEYIRQRVADQADRHAKHGRTVCRSRISKTAAAGFVTTRI
jgi:[protein-PII] uridylyltransferase